MEEVIRTLNRGNILDMTNHSKRITIISNGL